MSENKECIFPTLQGSSSIDSILYDSYNKSLTARRNNEQQQPNPPVFDLAQEYKSTHSYKKAREIIQLQMQNHKEMLIVQSDKLRRSVEKQKWKQKYVEERLATSGIPTVNSLPVVIARKKMIGDTSSKNELLQSKIRRATQLSFGAGRLDLQALQLEEIPEEIYNTFFLQMIHFVKELKLADNCLRELPINFCCIIQGLETIDCRSNVITRLPIEISRLNLIKTLIFDFNKLSSIPDKLPLNLTNLSLQNNYLTKLEYLHNTSQLTSINISRNQLSLLPNALYKIRFLKCLNVSYNKIISFCILPENEKKAVTTSDISPERCEDSDIARNWITQVDPISKSSVYYNKVTNEVSRSKPSCLIDEKEKRMETNGGSSKGIPPLNLETLENGNQEISKKQNNVDKKKVAGGWEIIQGVSNLAYYSHNLSKSFTEIPSELDRFQHFEWLTALNATGNRLTVLPNSIGKLKRLQTLDLEYNALACLPESIGMLQSLITLKLGNNSITDLPDSIVNLSSLIDLNIYQNRLRSLPDDLSKLSVLESLDLTCNYLESLPHSLVDMDKLKVLKLKNNPNLKVPSISAINAGLQAIFWECKNQHQIEFRGAPPSPNKITVGLKNECITTDIHVRKEFLQLIDKATNTLTLDFHWKNLSANDIPSQLYNLTNLLELRLTGHNISSIPLEIIKLRSLQLLNLRKNNISEIDEKCFISSFLNLEELNLEYNLLNTIPFSIGNLKKLKVLRLSRNHLESLPDSIGNLESMEELYISNNKLIRVPDSLSRAQNVNRIDLSYNQVDNLSFDISALTKLHHFRCNVNKLSSLPDSLGNSLLQELALSGNMFTTLPQVITNLKNLTKFWFQVNAIKELPIAFGSLAKLEVIELDGNPLRSPPPEVILEGVESIKMYLESRCKHINEIKSLLNHAEISFNEESFTPRAKNLIIIDENKGNTRFLTKEDLLYFDKTVDRYVNGKFYSSKKTGTEIVNAFIDKCYLRAQTARKKIVDELLQLLRLIREKKWLDKIDFRYDIIRPWNENGTDAYCYAVDPSALYEDTDDVPGILKVVVKREEQGFEGEAFKYLKNDVEDAVNNFIGPYGPVGISDEKVPFRCGCNDLIKSGKMHNPCYKSGWVITQLVFSNDEAQRKKKEEAMIEVALDRLREEIKDYLANTDEGKKRFKKEVKLIKSKLKKTLKVNKKLIPKVEKKIKVRTKELGVAKNQNIVDKAEKGKAWTLADEKNATFLIEDIEEDIANEKERVLRLKDEILDSKSRLRQMRSLFLNEVVELILIVAGAETKQLIIEKQRLKAIRRGYERPWDGIHGMDFIKFRNETLNLDEDDKVVNVLDFDANSEISDISSTELNAYNDSDSDGVASSEEELDEMTKKIENGEFSDDSSEESEDSNVESSGSDL